MKLRNKNTGEIGYTGLAVDGFLPVAIEGRVAGNAEQRYRTLAELNDDWEDYEEPVGWCVTMYGGISRIAKNDEIFIPDLKEIGNYFNDKESAYDALDKLKAWKRLKDKGFDIESWTNHIGDNYYKTGQIVLNLNNVRDREWDEYDQIMEIKNDLDLLFGGEE